MRGSNAQQMTMLAVADAGELIPQGHPIRRVRPVVESALVRLEPAFASMYVEIGRPSIPPERSAEGKPADRPLLDSLRTAVL